MAKVETQRCNVSDGAAFSLHLPYTVATLRLTSNLTVYVKYCRRDANVVSEHQTAVQSSLYSQVITIILHNLGLVLVSVVQPELSLHCRGLSSHYSY